MRNYLTGAFILISTVAALTSAGQKFYRDDPLWRDPETQDAAAVKPAPISEQYDFIENTFLDAGDKTPKRAVNINTVDEVPDSSWFTNRIGRDQWSTERLVRGPDTGSGPAPGPWTIVSGKARGSRPG